MVTFGIYGIGFLAVAAVLFFTVARLWGVEEAYVRTCVPPMLLLVTAYLLRHPLASALSYAAILVALLIFLISVAWTLMGLVLLISYRQRHQPPGRLVPATIVSALPAVVFIALLVWEYAVVPR